MDNHSDEREMKRVKQANGSEHANSCSLENVMQHANSSNTKVNSEAAAIEKICVVCMEAGNIDCPLGTHKCLQCADGAWMICEVIYVQKYEIYP